MATQRADRPELWCGAVIPRPHGFGAHPAVYCHTSTPQQCPDSSSSCIAAITSAPLPLHARPFHTAPAAPYLSQCCVLYLLPLHIARRRAARPPRQSLNVPAACRCRIQQHLQGPCHEPAAPTTTPPREPRSCRHSHPDQPEAAAGHSGTDDCCIGGRHQAWLSTCKVRWQRGNCAHSVQIHARPHKFTQSMRCL